MNEFRVRYRGTLDVDVVVRAESLEAAHCKAEEIERDFLLHAGDTSFLKLKYGVLEGEWQQDIKQGLEECW